MRTRKVVTVSCYLNKGYIPVAAGMVVATMWWASYEIFFCYLFRHLNAICLNDNEMKINRHLRLVMVI